jgi:effector-binding domain-containing protein
MQHKLTYQIIAIKNQVNKNNILQIKKNGVFFFPKTKKSINLLNKTVLNLHSDSSIFFSPEKTINDGIMNIMFIK